MSSCCRRNTNIMIIADINLTDEQIFLLKEYFYTEYDKDLIRKLLNVLQVHAGTSDNEAADAYIGAHREELVETYAPHMRRYFDESLDLCASHDLSGPLDSLWDELPWDEIDSEFQADQV